MTAKTPPSINRTKAVLPETARKRSLVKGVSLFALSAGLYAASFTALLLPLHPVLRLICSVINGGMVALLFIVGHDACHGSLTPMSWLNKTLGRVAFLPSWHPFICWDLGHNRLHHSWTNLRGRDYVWAPLSREEYEALPAWRRALERLYRTLPGVGVYYVWEIWVKHMIFPRASDMKRLSKKVLHGDRLLVGLFIIAQVLAAVFSARQFGLSPWISLLLAVVIPQALWNTLMGFVILLHHTHPRVRWFDDPEEWSFYAGQVGGTVHILFPWPAGPLLHHIMEHTAHHIDPRVPLYNLPAAQKAVENAYPEDVIRSPFSLKNLRMVLGACQLYDYRQHHWLTFDGHPAVCHQTVDATEAATAA